MLSQIQCQNKANTLGIGAKTCDTSYKCHPYFFYKYHQISNDILTCTRDQKLKTTWTHKFWFIFQFHHFPSVTPHNQQPGAGPRPEGTSGSASPASPASRMPPSPGARWKSLKKPWSDWMRNWSHGSGKQQTETAFERVITCYNGSLNSSWN